MNKRDKEVAKRSVTKAALYQEVFGTTSGKKIIQDLMRTHHLLGSTYDGDVNGTLIREGERRVLLRILNILKLDVQSLHERIESYEEGI